MKVIHGIEAVSPMSGSVLTIGNFDGVHRGHQQLLAQGALFATHRNVPLVVVTFEPHPLAVLRPKSSPARLTTLADRLDLLAQHGADMTAVAAVTGELLAMEARAFVELMVERFHPTHIVEGSTFGFGRGRKGTADTLRTLGGELGYEACIIPPVQLAIHEDAMATVNSSLIRSLITEGQVHTAALALGRPYSIAGRVAPGAGRGRGMGFPTANVSDVDVLVPADGVYAGAARVGATKSVAGISIGSNPTFGGSERKIEAHLLDFRHDVVGETIRLEFGKWLRPQRAFESREALMEQIACDIAAVAEHAAMTDTTPFRRRHVDDRETDL